MLANCSRRLPTDAEDEVPSFPLKPGTRHARSWPIARATLILRTSCSRAAICVVSGSATAGHAIEVAGSRRRQALAAQAPRSPMTSPRGTDSATAASMRSGRAALDEEHPSVLDERRNHARLHPPSARQLDQPLQQRARAREQRASLSGRSSAGRGVESHQRRRVAKSRAAPVGYCVTPSQSLHRP
jgi:hypothetical protein